MSGHQYTYEETEKIANTLLEKISFTPKIGVICGTGLGGLADTLKERVFVNYENIPNFPVSTVHGHVGRFVFGFLEGKPCVCMQGRFHMYEGYDAAMVALPVRVMKLLGVVALFVTNAAGGLNSSYNVGDIMIIRDHIFMPGFSGKNPLCGVNDERFGIRFPAVSGVYHKDLRGLAKKAAELLGLQNILHEGVYVMLGGPSFETIAECRMLRNMGADVVGMSTCPEVITASHCGMIVFGMSMVTNKCVMEYHDDRQANHEEVLETGQNRSEDIQGFVRKIVEMVPDSLLKTENSTN